MASRYMGTVSPTPLGRSSVSPAVGDSPAAQFRLAKGHQTDSSVFARTKVVCTLGPACEDDVVLEKMVMAGMNVARVSLALMSHEEASKTIERVRSVMKSSKRLIAIALDLQGSEIRAGRLAGGPSATLTEGKKITLVCVVKRGGTVSPFSTVGIPGVAIAQPDLSEVDAEDVAFAVEQGVDFVCVPHVRSASCVEAVRQQLAHHDGAGVRVIAKIETREGIDRVDEIVAAADCVLISRGGLGVEIPMEQVALVQKSIIKKCNVAGKAVITATQMMESMVENPSPTRAEVSDVSNAIFDGTDCVMLAGETAYGKWPVEAVVAIADTCRESEGAALNFSRVQPLESAGKLSINESIAAAAVQAARDTEATLLIVLTQSGNTARLVSKYRPNVPVLTVTADELVAAQMLVLRAAFPLLVTTMTGTDSLVDRIITTARALNMCKPGDNVVITRGADENRRGSTNMLKIVRVPDL